MNEINYADLSTYSPHSSVLFYKEVFGWIFHEHHGYFMAYIDDREIAGLYETPEKFKTLGMPHFWMTYIQVSDLNVSLNKAREMGGTIEFKDEAYPLGKMALIRDPQGAGFTIYEGDRLNVRTESMANTLIWNELHVSKTENVIPFYEQTFDWSFNRVEKDLYYIFTSEDRHIADMLVIPNSSKGKYEYWVCTFGVKDLIRTKQTILKHGGSIVFDEKSRVLCTDNSGESFFYIRELNDL